MSPMLKNVARFVIAAAALAGATVSTGCAPVGYGPRRVVVRGPHHHYYRPAPAVVVVPRRPVVYIR